MRVFVTGASGWIGSATIPQLVAAGHEVIGLARSDAAAEAVTAAGGTPHRGSLDDLDSIRAGAEGSDGVIHLGFKHDFSDMETAGRTERAVVQTIGDALEGSDRPFLFASGIALVNPGHVATETDTVEASGPDAPRGGGERVALDYAERGVRTVALRFAPTVHGEGDYGFTAAVVKVAREKGESGYIGDGANRWSAVNIADVATLIPLALENSPAGSAVHGIGEEGVSTRSMAEAIGRQLGVPVVSVAPEDADSHFGWIGAFYGMDVPASSEITQRALGWTPTHPGLIHDLDAGYYTRDH